MIRAFVAFDFDDATIDALTAVGEALRARAPQGKSRAPIKWTTRDQMHVTVKFLGSTTEAQAKAIADALPTIAGSMAPRARVDAIGAFPYAGRASVLIAPMRDVVGALARAAQAADDVASEQGFPRETRAFMPHATFARLRVPLDAIEWIARVPFAPFDARITGLTLYQSVLASTGARYTPIARAAYA